MTHVDEVGTLVSELESTATRLRSQEMSGEEAAAAVERCAELAARLAEALDRQAGAADFEPPAGQGELL